MSPTIPERMATLEAEARHQSERLAEAKVKLAEMQSDISAIKTILTRADGGWKMLVFIGGVAGAAGAILMWVVDTLMPFIPALPR